MTDFAPTLEDVVTGAVRDSAEKYYNFEDEILNGRYGGEVDTTSGVLILRATSGVTLADTEVSFRFVETTALFDALGRMGLGYSSEEWRLLLAEKLDTNEL